MVEGKIFSVNLICIKPWDVLCKLAYHPLKESWKTIFTFFSLLSFCFPTFLRITSDTSRNLRKLDALCGLSALQKMERSHDGSAAKAEVPPIFAICLVAVQFELSEGVSNKGQCGGRDTGRKVLAGSGEVNNDHAEVKWKEEGQLGRWQRPKCHLKQ